MINLLPPQVRDQIMYARRNTRLLRWIFILLFVLLGTCVIILFGQFYIKQTTQGIRKEVELGQQRLREQKLDETQKEVQDISDSLNLVIRVLSRQILFSKLIRQIGAAIPEGVVLTGLTISQVEGGIDLAAAATDFNKATQMQVNLQDPTNQIFEKADIINVSCNNETADTQYPCTVTIRALFAPNNQYQYITIPKTSSSGAQP